MCIRTKLLLSFVFVLGAATIAHGQTGSISGTILDPSGSGVPDASIQVRAVDTGTFREATTDQSGFFSVPNLLVGRYDVTVLKAGFQNLQFQGVTLTVAQNLTLNGTLQVGSVSQSVDVQGSAVPNVNLEDAQISNLVDQRRITELPLIIRDPYSLVLLSPGTQQTSSGLGGFSVNGQRERNNNFMLDGVDNNDPSVPGIAGGISSINPDSTQEFRVITNNFLPEFGRNTGAVVDIVTRSGSNDFHGSVYEFNRVRALAARDYFNPTPEPQNPFVRNQFGASFGGPIVRDKTFFFVNGEWNRFRTTLTNESIVPTAAFKTGVFNYDGQPINLADPASPNNALGLPLDPTMQKVFAAYPNPNGPAVDAIRGIYYFPTSQPYDAANVTYRMDHRFNDKYSVYGRYVYNGSTSGNSLNEIFPGVGGIATPAQAHNIAFNFIAAFRLDLVNEFRAGFNKSDVSFLCNGSSFLDRFSSSDPFGFGTDYLFLQSTNVDTIANFGCNALGDSNGQARRAGTWDFRDHLSFVHGTHSMKAGLEYRFIFDNGYDAFGSRPTVDFTAFGNFGIPIVNCAGACADDEVLQTMAAALLGVPGVQSQTQFYNAAGIRTPTDFRRFVQREYGVFFQDSWKIRPNLTFEYGLRYQFNGVPYERNGNLSNLLYQQPSDPGPITFQTVGPGTGRDLIFSDPYNFEPRLGLAWDPFRNGKTSVRIGYGIFHDRLFGNLFGNLKGNPPFVNSFQGFPNLDFSNGSGPLLTVSSLATPATQPAPSATIPEGTYLPNLTILSRTMKNPRTQAWNVGIQRQLGGGMLVEINYVGSGSHRLFRSVDGNPPLPWIVAAAHANGSLPLNLSGGVLSIAPQRGYPQLTGNTALRTPIVVESVGNATYNSLQIGFNKQFSHGLQFQANYAWSHAIDDAADPLVTTYGNRNIARNSFNLHEERGSSDNDLRHRLIMNWVYEIPFGPGHTHLSHGIAAHLLGGWELSGLATLQSGTPFTIYSSRDSEYTGRANRPDIIGDPSIPPDAPRNQTGPPVSAFAVQPFGQPGNLGRNVFTGPRYYNVDASLIKNNRFRENINLQFRAEVFNVFNRIQFEQPGTAASGNTISDPGTFGLSLTTRTQPDGTTSARQIQLALKLVF